MAPKITTVSGTLRSSDIDCSCTSASRSSPARAFHADISRWARACRGSSLTRRLQARRLRAPARHSGCGRGRVLASPGIKLSGSRDDRTGDALSRGADQTLKLVTRKLREDVVEGHLRLPRDGLGGSVRGARRRLVLQAAHRQVASGLRALFGLRDRSPSDQRSLARARVSIAFT